MLIFSSHSSIDLAVLPLVSTRPDISTTLSHFSSLANTIMDHDAPFSFQPPPLPADAPQSVSTTRSGPPGGAPPSTRSSQSTSHSNHSHRASMYPSHPPLGSLMEPRQFHEEVPAPTRPHVHPPLLAPYVTEDQRVRPPSVHAWGSVPDPGIQRYHQGDASRYLPGPIHQPPRTDRWRQRLHHEHDSSSDPGYNQDRPSHSAPVASSSERHVVHPPPHTAGPQMTFPPPLAAPFSMAMDRTYSRTSQQSVPLARTYSQAREASPQHRSRPSSHGSSYRETYDPSYNIGGGGDTPSLVGGLRFVEKRNKRPRALFTHTQSLHLKNMWKEVSTECLAAQLVAPIADAYRRTNSLP